MRVRAFRVRYRVHIVDEYLRATTNEPGVRACAGGAPTVPSFIVCAESHMGENI